MQSSPRERRLLFRKADSQPEKRRIPDAAELPHLDEGGRELAGLLQKLRDMELKSEYLPEKMKLEEIVETVLENGGKRVHAFQLDFGRMVSGMETLIHNADELEAGERFSLNIDAKQREGVRDWNEGTMLRWTRHYLREKADLSQVTRLAIEAGYVTRKQAEQFPQEARIMQKREGARPEPPKRVPASPETPKQAVVPLVNVQKEKLQPKKTTSVHFIPGYSAGNARAMHFNKMMKSPPQIYTKKDLVAFAEALNRYNAEKYKALQKLAALPESKAKHDWEALVGKTDKNVAQFLMEMSSGKMSREDLLEASMEVGDGGNRWSERSFAWARGSIRSPKTATVAKQKPAVQRNQRTAQRQPQRSQQRAFTSRIGHRASPRPHVSRNRNGVVSGPRQPRRGTRFRGSVPNLRNGFTPGMSREAQSESVEKIVEGSCLYSITPALPQNERHAKMGVFTKLENGKTWQEEHLSYIPYERYISERDVLIPHQFHGRAQGGVRIVVPDGYRLIWNGIQLDRQVGYDVEQDQYGVARITFHDNEEVGFSIGFGRHHSDRNRFAYNAPEQDERNSQERVLDGVPLSADTERLLQRLKNSDLSNIEKAVEIRRHILTTFLYTTDSQYSDAYKAAENYLQSIDAGFATTGGGRVRLGDCDVVNTYFVACCRQVDVPARLAVGFLIEPPPDSTRDEQLVMGEQLHGWAEIKDSRGNWLEFDSTPQTKLSEEDEPFSNANVQYVQDEKGNRYTLSTLPKKDVGVHDTEKEGQGESQGGGSSGGGTEGAGGEKDGTSSTGGKEGAISGGQTGNSSGETENARRNTSTGKPSGLSQVARPHNAGRTESNQVSTNTTGATRPSFSTTSSAEQIGSAYSTGRPGGVGRTGGRERSRTQTEAERKRQEAARKRQQEQLSEEKKLELLRNVYHKIRHNIEQAERVYPTITTPSTYEQSCDVLEKVAACGLWIVPSYGEFFSKYSKVASRNELQNLWKRFEALDQKDMLSEAAGLYTYYIKHVCVDGSRPGATSEQKAAMVDALIHFENMSGVLKVYNDEKDYHVTHALGISFSKKAIAASTQWAIDTIDQAAESGALSPDDRHRIYAFIKRQWSLIRGYKTQFQQSWTSLQHPIHALKMRVVDKCSKFSHHDIAEQMRKPLLERDYIRLGDAKSYTEISIGCMGPSQAKTDLEKLRYRAIYETGPHIPSSLPGVWLMKAAAYIDHTYTVRPSDTVQNAPSDTEVTVLKLHKAQHLIGKIRDLLHYKNQMDDLHIATYPAAFRELEKAYEEKVVQHYEKLYHDCWHAPATVGVDAMPDLLEKLKKVMPLVPAGKREDVEKYIRSCEVALVFHRDHAGMKKFLQNGDFVEYERARVALREKMVRLPALDQLHAKGWIKAIDTSHVRRLEAAVAPIVDKSLAIFEKELKDISYNTGRIDIGPVYRIQSEVFTDKKAFADYPRKYRLDSLMPLLSMSRHAERHARLRKAQEAYFEALNTDIDRLTSTARLFESDASQEGGSVSLERIGINIYTSYVEQLDFLEKAYTFAGELPADTERTIGRSRYVMAIADKATNVIKAAENYDFAAAQEAVRDMERSHGIYATSLGKPRGYTMRIVQKSKEILSKKVGEQAVSMLQVTLPEEQVDQYHYEEALQEARANLEAFLQREEIKGISIPEESEKEIDAFYERLIQREKASFASYYTEATRRISGNDGPNARLYIESMQKVLDRIKKQYGRANISEEEGQLEIAKAAAERMYLQTYESNNVLRTLVSRGELKKAAVLLNALLVPARNITTAAVHNRVFDELKEFAGRIPNGAHTNDPSSEGQSIPLVTEGGAINAYDNGKVVQPFRYMFHLVDEENERYASVPPEESKASAELTPTTLKEWEGLGELLIVQASGSWLNGTDHLIAEMDKPEDEKSDAIISAICKYRTMELPTSAIESNTPENTVRVLLIDTGEGGIYYSEFNEHASYIPFRKLKEESVHLVERSESN